MHKDLKIGMIFGLFLAFAVGIWLTGKQDLSIESRLETVDSGSVDQTNQPSRFEMSLPGTQANSSQSSEIPDIFPDPSRAEETTTRFYTVKDGDTLSSIAMNFYGSTRRIDDIRKANQAVIKKPDVIVPGMRLIIPE